MPDYCKQSVFSRYSLKHASLFYASYEFQNVKKHSERSIMMTQLLALLDGNSDDVIGIHAYGGKVRMVPQIILLTASQADPGTCCMPGSDHPEEVTVRWRTG